MQNILDIEQKNILLRKTIVDKDRHIKILEEYILLLKQKQFGSSSEKLSPAQAELFDEADGDVAEIETDNAASINTIEIPAHTRSTKRRVSISADIARVDIIHDLSDDQKICPHDGAVLKRIGSETHEQLDIIPAKVQALHHIRYKYACPCCENIGLLLPNLRNLSKRALRHLACWRTSPCRNMWMPCRCIDKLKFLNALA